MFISYTYQKTIDNFTVLLLLGHIKSIFVFTDFTPMLSLDIQKLLGRVPMA